MVKHLAICALALWAAATARADDTVECERSPEACEAAILVQCPAGAEVLSEEVVSAQDAPVVRYRTGFRCLAEAQGAPAQRAATVVSPPATQVAPAPAPATPQDDLDERFAALKVERRRTSYVGPISLTAVGFGLTGFLLGTGFDVKSGAHPDGEGPDDEIAASLWVMSALSLGVGVGGAFWLAKRVKKRRAVDRELDAIETQRRTLTLGLDPASRRLWAGGHF